MWIMNGILDQVMNEAGSCGLPDEEFDTREYMENNQVDLLDDAEILYEE